MGVKMKHKEFEIKISYKQFEDGHGVVEYHINDYMNHIGSHVVEKFSASSIIGIDEAIEKAWEIFWETRGNDDTTKE